MAENLRETTRTSSLAHGPGLASFIRLNSLLFDSFEKTQFTLFERVCAALHSLEANSLLPASELSYVNTSTERFVVEDVGEKVLDFSME